MNYLLFECPRGIIGMSELVVKFTFLGNNMPCCSTCGIWFEFPDDEFFN